MHVPFLWSMFPCSELSQNSDWQYPETPLPSEPASPRQSIGDGHQEQGKAQAPKPTVPAAPNHKNSKVFQLGGKCSTRRTTASSQGKAIVRDPGGRHHSGKERKRSFNDCQMANTVEAKVKLYVQKLWGPEHQAERFRQRWTAALGRVGEPT